MFKYNILFIVLMLTFLGCSLTPEADVSEQELEQEVQNVLEVE